MGENHSWHVLEKRVRVVGLDPVESSLELPNADLTELGDICEFHSQLLAPGITFIYIPVR